MNQLIFSSFIPKRKFTDPDKMSADDWAELILDFHVFCKTTMNNIKEDNPKENFSGERIRKTLCYSQNRLYQMIDWRKSDLEVYMEGIERDDPIRKIYRFCWTMFSGLTMFAVMDRNKDLFLCMATFGNMVRERNDKDDVYYATAVTVRPLTIENLSLALALAVQEYQNEPNTIKVLAQDFLKELYKATVAYFKEVQESEAYKRISQFENNFGKEVLEQYAC